MFPPRFKITFIIYEYTIKANKNFADFRKAVEIRKNNIDNMQMIVKYIENHGYPPAVQKIGDEVGFHSTSTTWNRLQQMLKNGMIESDNPSTARAIRVPGYKLVKVEEPEEKGE